MLLFIVIIVIINIKNVMNAKLTIHDFMRQEVWIVE